MASTEKVLLSHQHKNKAKLSHAWLEECLKKKGQRTCTHLAQDNDLNSQNPVDKMHFLWVSLTLAWKDNINVVCYLTFNLRT